VESWLFESSRVVSFFSFPISGGKCVSLLLLRERNCNRGRFGSIAGKFENWLFERESVWRKGRFPN